MVSINFHFSFGIYAVVHKLYLSHVAKKVFSSDTNLAVQLKMIRIDFTIEVVEGLFYLDSIPKTMALFSSATNLWLHFGICEQQIFS